MAAHHYACALEPIESDDAMRDQTRDNIKGTLVTVYRQSVIRSEKNYHTAYSVWFVLMVGNGFKDVASFGREYNE